MSGEGIVVGESYLTMDKWVIGTSRQKKRVLDEEECGKKWFSGCLGNIPAISLDHVMKINSSGLPVYVFYRKFSDFPLLSAHFSEIANQINAKVQSTWYNFQSLNAFDIRLKYVAAFSTKPDCIFMHKHT